jgi:leucyl aminopeptidase (aminopeptidase T)
MSSRLSAVIIRLLAKIAASLTRTSSFGYFALNSAARPRTDASEDKSAFMRSTDWFPLSDTTWVRAVVPRVSSRQTIITIAPISAMAVAVALPMPELAPVTRQTFPFISAASGVDLNTGPMCPANYLGSPARPDVDFPSLPSRGASAARAASARSLTAPEAHAYLRRLIRWGSLSDQTLYDQVARKTLTETLHLGKGETITIETWGNGLPLAKRFLLEARRLGAIPILLFEDESTYIESISVTPKDVLGTMGRHEYGLLAGSDAYLFIPGPPIGAYAPRLNRQVVAESTRYNASWYEAAEKAKLRGARLPFGFVGIDYSKLLGKKPEEIARNQLKAALVDLTSVGARGLAIAQQMQDGAVATLRTGEETVEFTLKGEVVVEDGVVDASDVEKGNNVTYIPPGLVSKQVESASVSGSLKLSPTITRLGLLKDAVLEFKGGKLVKWRSKGSPAMLSELIEGLQPEKRVLSLVTIGINPSMKYENGQDRMVAGALAVSGFGLSGIIRKGTLSVGGRSIVLKGRLSS